MSDFTLVEPKGWEYDLHSVYSAYIGYFQVYNVPWYERSWGHLFETFEQFLAFSWPTITVTDAFTGRPHIVTCQSSIRAFLKMIKTRFGETLPQAPNILQVVPFETTQRHLRHVTDYGTYKKLHGTLPAIVSAALKARIRGGDPKSIKDLWDKRDKTFLAIDFEWNEKNHQTVLEWGYAAVRCGHLEALNHWPPQPDTNYRKGHYIVADYVDKVTNKYCPNYPWQYTFGDSQVIPKSKIPQIIQAVISSLASPDSETTANHLVLVAHGLHGDLARLDEMKIKLPHNMLVIDVSVYERSMFSAGLRGPMVDPNSGGARGSGVTLSLEQLVNSLTLPLPASNAPLAPDGTKQKQIPFAVPPCTFHNAGNDAFMTLFAFQKLLQHDTSIPTPTGKKSRLQKPTTPMISHMVVPNGMPMAPSSTMPPMLRASSAYDLGSEFGQMQLSMTRNHSSPAYLTTPRSSGDRSGRRTLAHTGIAG